METQIRLLSLLKRVESTTFAALSLNDHYASSLGYMKKQLAKGSTIWPRRYNTISQDEELDMKD